MEDFCETKATQEELGLEKWDRMQEATRESETGKKKDKVIEIQEKPVKLHTGKSDSNTENIHQKRKNLVYYICHKDMYTDMHEQRDSKHQDNLVAKIMGD